MVDVKWKMGNGISNFEFRISNLSLVSFKYLYKRVFIILITIFSFFENSFAQSVDSLINEAMLNNPYLKSIEQKIYSGQYRAESVDYLPPPTLGVQFDQIPIKEINIWNSAISNSLSLSQMFPLGGKLSAMNKVELQNVEVTKRDYDSYKINLIAQIKMQYYNIWQIERKLDVQQGTIDLLNNILSSVDVSYQVNRINQADLLTVKSEVASNNAQLVILKKQREAEIYKLNKLLGRKLNSNEIVIEKSIAEDSLTYSQDELETILIDSNPSLRKMGTMIEMNKAMVNANNSELVPDLMIEGMFMRMPQGMILTSQSDISMIGMESASTEYMYSLMASITLPFVPWSSGKYSNKEEELLSDIKGIEYEKNNMQREMITELQTAFVKLKTAQELINLYSKEVIPSYEQAAESQLANYQNNRTNITTVIDSYRMLLMQRMNFYMAQADRQMAIAEIEMMVGKRL
ncbi:MAG: TolC family protein [Ignavibacteriota bacterium]|nr:MAG: TolC family protein [Chlorobiota bacterium]MBE7476891.1 TolC family protein [Ignavibacteriales bacterium]MBL1121858.1 TolC family protein [Ignavibacteriota bacterium]MCC7094849.1 TolC family protein [Ignavibacteriaceae bacterium]MCE7857817.1 TolC family protein [Ignavibacteria bacterium CHB3]